MGNSLSKEQAQLLGSLLDYVLDDEEIINDFVSSYYNSPGKLFEDVCSEITSELTKIEDMLKTAD